MLPTDYLYGTFEGIETNVVKDNEGYYVASALGRTAKAVDQMQAISDLNNILMDAMARGELSPENGN